MPKPWTCPVCSEIQIFVPWTIKIFTHVFLVAERQVEILKAQIQDQALVYHECWDSKAGTSKKVIKEFGALKFQTESPVSSHFRFLWPVKRRRLGVPELYRRCLGLLW